MQLFFFRRFPLMRLNILAFACGVALLQMQGVLPGVYGLGGAALLALLCLHFAPQRQLFWLALRIAACAVLGFVWAGGMAHYRLADQLPLVWEAKDIEISGVVASLPQRFERGERFEFVVDAVGTPQALVPERLMLAWYHTWEGQGDASEGAESVPDEGKARGVRPGERWRFTVRLKRPHGNSNPHAFDYEAWLLERGIRATGTIRTRGEAQRLDDFVMRPGYAIERLRDSVRQRFTSSLPEAPYLGVLIALSMGDQRAIPNAQWQVFNRTGVTHLVSISGLHVTMIAALFAALLNALWRRSERLVLRLPAQKAALIAGWLAALAYALLAGFEVPAQRTLYMLSVVALALWSGRNFGVSRTLLLALLAVLVLDPWAVLAAGFWLSFGAVALLFYVGNSRLGRGAENDGVRASWRASLAAWGATQWAVTIGSLPLLLLFFQQFSLVSPLANALAIPFVSFVITPLALLFVVLPWPPLLQFDHWLMSQLMVVLEWLAQWPVWQQAAPPLWAVLLALLGVFCLLLPRGFPARWLGLYLLAPAVFMSPARPVAGEAWVDVLDVGQGLAVLVRTAGHTLLYDSGPQYSADSNAGQRVVVPYLRALGVSRLDTLVISHRDKDHAGGVNAVRDYLPVGRSLSSIEEPDYEPCTAGQGWSWDGVGFSLLHPEAAAYSARSKKSNAMSCVLRVEASGSSMLLTADIEAADETALRRRALSALRSSVLLVPHHGGRGSSTPEFIAAVGARDVVFSAGYRNAFGHPRPEVIARYSSSRQWRTDRDGAIRVMLGQTAGVSAWRQEHPRYWYGQ